MRRSSTIATLRRRLGALTIACSTLASLAGGSTIVSARETFDHGSASAANGPFLVTVQQPGTHQAQLLAVQPGHSPRVLVSDLPGQTRIAPSPRGRYVALAEDVRGLWILDSTGHGLRRLLFPPASSSPTSHRLVVGSVAWSPDRYTIAYTIMEAPLNPDAPRLTLDEPDPSVGIWLVRYDTGRPRQVATARHLGYNLGHLSWSSDGRRIAVTGLRLAVVTITTGYVRHVSIQMALDAAFSPTTLSLVVAAPSCATTSRDAAPHADLGPKEGSGVMFCATDADGQQTHVLGRDSTLSAEGVDGMLIRVVWSPDGRRLALLIDRARRCLEIRILDVATGHVRKMVLASSYAPTYDFSDLAWLHVRI